MNIRTRILIVDDHPLMRKGLAQLLSLEQDFNVIGEAASGQEALQFVQREKPDLVILDLNMAGMNGIQTLSALHDVGCTARIIVYTVSDNHEDLSRALRAGADGYLLKDMEPESLIDAIRETLDGQVTVSPQLTSAMARALRDNATPALDLSSLTDREQQILQLIAEGQSNKRIARSLDIAEATVKVHVKHLLKKLNMHSRVEAAIWVVQQRRET
ncbi:MAG: two-component system response regulator NarL [Gammaproteobacteria bacterium]